MKVSVVLAGLVWPVLAFGQQLYTNADLSKIDVPGAYTNQDLRRLPPLAMQKEPAATLPRFVATAPSDYTIARYEEDYRSLRQGRDSLALELNQELKRVDFAYPRRRPIPRNPRASAPDSTRRRANRVPA